MDLPIAQRYHKIDAMAGRIIILWGPKEGDKGADTDATLKFCRPDMFWSQLYLNYWSEQAHKQKLVIFLYRVLFQADNSK